ncbi:MAG: FAD-dependent oxidoreductase [Armatimonadota bacterium]|nr:FAD-dependent oxidoreductase [Armatimonadota bacterium]
MSDTDRYDLAVIGAGPGGYVAALRARQLDLSVALVEEREVGGTCLNRGCIPAKALLHTAHILESCESASRFGVVVEDLSIDVERVRRHKQRAVKQLVTGVETLLERAGVELIRGHGRFAGEHEVTVTTGDGQRTIEAEHIIVATGSEPVIDVIEGARSKNVWTSDTALNVPFIPESMIVIGSGATGAEMACAYLHFGTDVTLMELFDRPLPREDHEASEVVMRTFQRRGGRTEVSAMVRRIEDAGDAKRVIFERNDEEEQLEAQVVLLTMGREANLEELGAEEIGLEIERQGICVQEGVSTPASDPDHPHAAMCPGTQLRTSMDHIYAIGDCIRGIGLAHLAMHEGVAAVEATQGIASHINYNAVPTATYCHPEIASVGLVEYRAKELGIEVNVGRFPFAANGRAVCTGARHGFAKLLSDPQSGRLLGATVCGTYATELMPELTLAIEQGLSVDAIIDVIHAHPTLSEALHEAALAAQGRPLHIPFA